MCYSMTSFSTSRTTSTVMNVGLSRFFLPIIMRTGVIGVGCASGISMVVTSKSGSSIERGLEIVEEFCLQIVGIGF